MQPGYGLVQFPLQEIQHINAPLSIIAALSREEELPFLTCGENRHGDAVMHCVSKQLMLGVCPLPNLFDFDQYKGLSSWMAESVISPRAAKSELGRNDRGIERWPPQFVQESQHDALRNRRLVSVAALFQVFTDIRYNCDHLNPQETRRPEESHTITHYGTLSNFQKHDDGVAIQRQTFPILRSGVMGLRKWKMWRAWDH